MVDADSDGIADDVVLDAVEDAKTLEAEHEDVFMRHIDHPDRCEPGQVVWIPNEAN